MNNGNFQNYYLPSINRPYSVVPIQAANGNYMPLNQPEIIFTYPSHMQPQPLQDQPRQDDLLMQLPQMQQPLIQQPLMQQPSMQQPSMQQSLMQQSSMQQPLMQQSRNQQPPMQLAQINQLPLQLPQIQQPQMQQFIVPDVLMQVSSTQQTPFQQPQIHSFTISPISQPNSLQSICRPIYWSYKDCEAMGIYPDLNECIMRLRRKVSELMYTLHSNQPNVQQYLNATGLSNILDSYDAMKYYLRDNLGADAAGDVFEELGLRRPIFITQQDVDSLIIKRHTRKRRLDI